MRWITAYDISDHRRRYRVARALLHSGYRIQRSVYESCLETDRVDTLAGDIQALIEPARDVVHMFPVCGACQEGVRRIGQGTDPWDSSYLIF